MQVKKFEASTLQEAMDSVKREMGPEAIILQTKKHKRGFGLMSKASVEITVAVSERSLHKKKFAERGLPEDTKAEIQKLPAERQAMAYDKYMDHHLDRMAQSTRERVDVSVKPAPTKPITVKRYIDIEDDRSMPIEEEVKHLKRMLDEIKSAQEDGLSGGAEAMFNRSASGGILSTPVLQDAFEQLTLGGVDKRYALSLVKKVAFELGDNLSQNPDEVLDQMAKEIMVGVEVCSPLTEVQEVLTARKDANQAVEVAKGPISIAVVGPTGVGKTTTIAKLASDAILRRGMKVGLINLDTYKVAAFDQLATYAKILNVPFRSATSVDDLKSAMQDFQNLDLVLIDSTGRSQRNPGTLNEMQSMIYSIPNVKTQLVLAATTRDIELYDMANRFSIFKPQGIIMSKLDEATIFGCIYNVCQKSKLPLLYFTTGQRVPEDLEEATRERIAGLIMDL